MTSSFEILRRVQRLEQCLQEFILIFAGYDNVKFLFSEEEFEALQASFAASMEEMKLDIVNEPLKNVEVSFNNVS